MVGEWIEGIVGQSAKDRWIWSAMKVVALAMRPDGLWSILVLHLDGQLEARVDIRDVRVITDAEVAKYRRNFAARDRAAAKRAVKRQVMMANK